MDEAMFVQFVKGEMKLESEFAESVEANGASVVRMCRWGVRAGTGRDGDGGIRVEGFQNKMEGTGGIDEAVEGSDNVGWWWGLRVKELENLELGDA